jgi:undecaprenyl-diphosphatase
VDINIFYFFNKSLSNPVLDFVAFLITDIDLWRLPLFLIWLSFLVLGDKRVKLICILAGIALFLSDFSANQLKDIFHRLRPYEVLEDVRTVGKLASGYAFPSCHAANVFSVATIITFFNYFKKLIIGIFVFFTATSISLARIYTGMHYPSDVLAGAILGIFVALIIITIFSLGVKYRKKYL